MKTLHLKHQVALWLCFLVTLLLYPAAGLHAQTARTLPQGTEYLAARFAYYAPDGSHLLVTLCEVREGRCRPWRYHLAERRWERIELAPYDPAWSMESATYAPDGKTIAVSVVKCIGDWRTLQCPLFQYRLALIDASSGAVRILPSEQARFMPSFTPDGKGLVYWGLDNATPSRSGQAVYASHNLYTLDLADLSSRKAINVRTQRPLAPPKVLADGQTVTISAFDVSGDVTYQGEMLKNGMLNNVQGFDDSVLLGNLTTGEMQTLLPKGRPSKVIYDISPDGKWVLYSEDDHSVVQFALQNPAQRQVLKPSPRLSPKRIKHASYSPDGKYFVHVFGGYGEIGISSNPPNSEFEFLSRPTWLLN